MNETYSMLYMTSKLVNYVMMVMVAVYAMVYMIRAIRFIKSNRVSTASDKYVTLNGTSDGDDTQDMIQFLYTTRQLRPLILAYSFAFCHIPYKRCSRSYAYVLGVWAAVSCIDNLLDSIFSGSSLHDTVVYAAVVVLTSVSYYGVFLITRKMMSRYAC